jgi:sodium-dependent phosphate cotransporter
MALSIYFFISSIVLIKESVSSMGQGALRFLINLISDTTTGVLVGWFGTALIQSSGAFDSITVTLVSAGVLPMTVGVAIIIGAELGTTVTTQLVSILGYLSRDKEVFKLSFGVAMTHYWYNLVTLLIFFPIELSSGLLTRVALEGTRFFGRIPGITEVPSIFDLITPWIDALLSFIPAWSGMIIGCAILMFSLRESEKHMSAVFATEVSQNLLQSTFGDPIKSFLAGLVFTILVPSTSVMVSLLVPLTATKLIRADQHILPYILGANIGTVFDVMVAALVTGDPAAIGVWLVHLTINIIGALLFLPVMKPFIRFVQKANDFLTGSRNRTILFFSLFNGSPLALLLARLFT